MSKWLLLAGAIATEVTGSLALKGALNHPALYVVVALGFIAAFTFLTGALREGMPLGVAYGVWAACGVALTAVLSAVIYAEPFTPLMAVGVVLIMAGVLLVELGSRDARSSGPTDASPPTGVA